MASGTSFCAYEQKEFNYRLSGFKSGVTSSNCFGFSAYAAGLAKMCSKMKHLVP